MTDTVYRLGGVHLPYSRFEWSKYRGCIAKKTEIDCPLAMYDELRALARNSPGGKTTLEFTCPSSAGGEGTASVVCENVYITRLYRKNEQICTVELQDARSLLSRRVADMDFRIKFGDRYLDRTDFAKYGAAITELFDSVDVLKDNKAPNVLANFTDMDIREKIYLSGQPLMHGLNDMLDQANSDLAVINAGRFIVSSRGDIAQRAALPSLQSYDWFDEAGWLHGVNAVSGQPRTVRPYYYQRHCLALRGSDLAISHTVDDTLQVELEQVYACQGLYVNLEDLLAMNFFAPSLFKDSDIATYFYVDGLEGIEPSFDALKITNFHGRVTDAIRDGWRTLWRVKYPAARGGLGAFTDWVFGKIKEDGSVEPVSVKCPWVEFKKNVATAPGGRLVGSPWTVNQDTESPFIARWEGDASNGIIRLEQRSVPDGSFAHPGALTSALTMRYKPGNVLTDGKGNNHPAPLEFDVVIEKQPLDHAVFEKNFDVVVYVCATQRMPNSEARWHKEDVPGVPSGDIEYVELQPSERVYCVRDYVDSADPAHAAEPDGFGPILNKSELEADAAARAAAWKLTYISELEGTGVAEGLALFRDYECVGPIQELTLVVDGPVIRTRITAGNLANMAARERRNQKRQAVRKWDDRGVEIV